MAKASSQKFIARNRAPRVQIEYDLELYGAQKKVNLPFVMGVMADLSGNPAEPLPPVAEALDSRSPVGRFLLSRPISGRSTDRPPSSVSAVTCPAAAPDDESLCACCADDHCMTRGHVANGCGIPAQGTPPSIGYRTPALFRRPVPPAHLDRRSVS